MITRRTLLAAVVAAPIATAVKQAPLTVEELRVLAMAATPPETWENNQDEYIQTRIADPGTELHRIVERLHAMGLVDRHETSRYGMEWYATASPAGIEQLRQAGVLD